MLTAVSKQYLMVGAGLGAAFLGYCVYFDYRRRHAPDFRKKLMEKRRQQREAKRLKAEGALPDLRDAEAVQKYFMEQIQTGEQLLGQGDVENGVDHLANAVAVSAHPTHLLQMLQQTLPNQIFSLIVESLPKAKQKITNAREALLKDLGAGSFGIPVQEKQKTVEITEDDVE